VVQPVVQLELLVAQPAAQPAAAPAQQPSGTLAALLPLLPVVVTLRPQVLVEYCCRRHSRILMRKAAREEIACSGLLSAKKIARILS